MAWSRGAARDSGEQDRSGKPELQLKPSTVDVRPLSGGQAAKPAPACSTIPASPMSEGQRLHWEWWEGKDKEPQHVQDWSKSSARVHR